jgi:hypothetical protein
VERRTEADAVPLSEILEPAAVADAPGRSRVIVDQSEVKGMKSEVVVEDDPV